MPKKYIKGEVNLSRINLMQLPDFLSDVKIQGDFNCSVNHLSNLVNAPSEVEGSFDCTENKLKSLEGNQIQGVKLMNGESLEEFIKRNKSK